MIRIRFSNAAVRAIERRATDLQGRRACEQCGRETPTRADYEIDHCVPEGIHLPYDARLPLSEAHGKLLCLDCHGKKTRTDVREIARAKRLAEKHRRVGKGPSEIARRFGVEQD